jgi:hypothetical protein
MTVRGCIDHESILRCPPGQAFCDWPDCAGQIREIEPGMMWNRDEQGWRGTPARVPLPAPNQGDDDAVR